MKKGLVLMLSLSLMMSVAHSGRRPTAGPALSTQQMQQLNKQNVECVKGELNCTCHKKSCQNKK